MNNEQHDHWPTNADMDRVWTSTQNEIARKQHTAKMRKVTLLAGTGTLVLGISAAAIVIPATQFQIDNTTRCYSAQSTTSEYTDAAQADGMDPLGVAGAISSCEATWAYGFMVPGKFVGPENTNHGPVTTSPALGACLNPNNTVVVFPLKDERGTVLTEEQLCQKVNLRLAAR